MRLLREYLPLMLCTCSIAVPTVAGALTTSELLSNTTRANVKYSSTTLYYYMNNPAVCTNFGSTQYFYDMGDTAFVKAWSPKRSRSSITGGCSVTFKSFGNLGMKYKFDSSNSYIYDCDVILRIYDSSGTSASPKASYSCGDHIPTGYIYTDSGYITVELVTPTSWRTNYDFQITINSHGDDYYYNGGDIAATVISLFVFFLLIASLMICLRRRRRQSILRATLIASPPATSTYPEGPAPYPNSYGSTTTTTVYPPPSAGYAGGPPCPPAYQPPGTLDTKPSGSLPPPPVYAP